MIKRKIALILALCLLFLPLVGCRGQQDGDKLTVVCTLFPLYDWIREVVGDSESVEVVLLVQNGTDLHSFQPSAADIVRLRSCDLLVRLGGGADGWVEDALRQAPVGDRRDLKLLETDGMTLRDISAESVAQGHDHEHDHDHDHEHEHEHDESCAVDEHFWLSLANACASVSAIADTLAELDEGNASVYRENAARYGAELLALDREYRETVAQSEDPYLVFGDRFPFVYLTEEYGIGYLAAFAGCGTDGDATVDTVIRLARTLDERGLGFVVVTEGSDGELAEGVIRASADGSREILTVDSLQSVTGKELKSGKTYLGAMRENLAILRRALLP